MKTQYEAIAEEFENIVSLDTVDELIEALQQRKDAIIEEAKNDTYEEETTQIKEEMDNVLRNSRKEMLEIAKGLNPSLRKVRAYIDNSSDFYLGVKYSELLNGILITMRERGYNNLKDYYTHIKNKENQEGIEYFTISMNTDLDNPDDIYSVDDYNDIIIQRDMGTDVIIPY